ncbi:MAG: hypothetical protein ACREIF_14310 [Chthoniobacterales bacterium]
MSKSTVSSSASACAPMADLAELGTRFVDLAFASANEFIKQSSAFFSGTTPQMSASRSPGCCVIPQSECPPHCACELSWEASPGETIRFAIQVTNRSSATHNFIFQAQPFSLSGGSLGEIALVPKSAQLAPGQTAVVAGAFQITEAFTRGATYRTEILVTGGYQQHVCLSLLVESEEIARCTIEQGDPPMRIRAHEWYSHFQCSEPCFPERTSTNIAGRG